MSISDDDFEKLIHLVDANRAGLERLRIELQEFKRLREMQGLRASPRRTDPPEGNQGRRLLAIEH
jgi:hypothetical protein